MKIYLMLFILFSANAHSLCVSQDVAQKLGCSEAKSQESCELDYGSGTSVIEEGICLPKSAVAILKLKVPSNILGKIKSSSDEIDSILTMIDRKGIKNDFFELKMVEVKTFNEGHIKSLLSKMSVLRESIYSLSISADEVNSTLGKQAVIYAARYYSFISRIHQILANAAHSQENHNLDFNQLQKFSLKLDKRIGLEILARMNLKAKHLDSETLKFVVSEEEKQSYEFNVLQSPHTLNQYAKLIQFMSIRELLSNKWALERMSNQTMDNPKVAYCGPKMLSFRPGPDQTMATSSVNQELYTFDTYFSQYPKLIDDLLVASKKTSLMSADDSLELVSKVFKSLPSFSKRMTEEFGWTSDELDGWKKDIASTLKQNEDTEWEQYAKSTLGVSVFPGDKMTSANLTERIVEDIFNLRKEAVVTQMNSMMDDLSPVEKAKMAQIVGGKLEGKRSQWIKSMGPQVQPIVAKMNDVASIKSQNYMEKLSQTKEIATSALSAAYFQNYIVDKKLKNKFGPNKLKLNDLEPKSPAEMIEFFQTKLIKNNGLSYYIDSDANKRKIVTDFFQEVSAAFSKLSSKQSVQALQLQLFAIANEEAQKIFKKYPMPVVEVIKTKPLDEVQKLRIKASDNARVVTPKVIPYLKLKVDPKGGEFSYDPKKKGNNPPVTLVKKEVATEKSENIRSGYNSLSMARLNPSVSDKTRVAFNRRIPEFKKKNAPKGKDYIVHIDVLNRLVKTENFINAFFGMLNIGRSGSSKSFLGGMVDQNTMADIRLATAYSASALLKIPLTRVHYVAGPTSYDGVSVDEEVKEEKPSLIRMISAFKLKADGTHSVDEVSLVGIIKETINIAIENQKGKTTAVCMADYRKPGSDKNFKDIFRSSTFIRQGILSNDALSEEVATRLHKLDEDLKKETRYWHERISEDWVEPMMNVAAVLFIVSAIIIPILSSGGILAPGSFLLLMTLLDGADLCITGASLYFRSVSTFYEIPAQVKFQKSLAFTQIDGFALTSWDDVSAAEAESKLSKTMLLAFSPLDAIVGGQLYFSAKKLLGVSGKQAIRRAGLQARGFGVPPQTLAPRLALRQMIKQKGIIKGTVSKVTQEAKALKYWTPRYQPITETELTSFLRTSLVAKSKRISIGGVGMGAEKLASNLSDMPWKLVDDLKAATKSIDSRLDVNKVLNEVTGRESEQVRMAGKMTFKEFLNKPSYSMEWMVPKTMVKAAKDGKLLDYLSNWDGVIEKMGRLRGKLLNKRKAAIGTLIEKLEEVEKMSVSNPGFLASNGKSSWMDHFQSLLSDEELKSLRDISKTSTGRLAEFKSIFRDHEVVLETIVPFSTVSGKSMAKLGTSYGHMVNSSSTKEDLRQMYLDLLENDGSVHIGDNSILDLRRSIEDELN